LTNRKTWSGAIVGSTMRDVLTWVALIAAAGSLIALITF
jgi:hypothetical protein